MAKRSNFRFDAVLFPSNVMDWNFRIFIYEVMPVALKEGLAIQTMDGKFILQSNVVSLAECLQYALTMPTSVVIQGMDTMEYLENSVEVVRNFKPLTKDQVLALTSRAKEAAKTGKYELFKTTSHFDSTAKTRSG